MACIWGIEISEDGEHTAEEWELADVLYDIMQDERMEDAA